MKKPNNRIRKNLNEAAGVLQGANISAILNADTWHLLLNSSGECDEGLWAAPDGRLFIWGQPELQHMPRNVDFVEAAKWVRKVHGNSSKLLPPCYPENSAAWHLIDLLENQVSIKGARQAPKQRKLPKGFFLVNLSRREQEEMRRLARALGVELRTMISHGLFSIRQEYEEKLRIANGLTLNPDMIWKLTNGSKLN